MGRAAGGPGTEQVGTAIRWAPPPLRARGPGHMVQDSVPCPSSPVPVLRLARGLHAVWPTASLLCVYCHVPAPLRCLIPLLGRLPH